MVAHTKKQIKTNNNSKKSNIMDNYVYIVVETEKQEYQEAKPGRNLFFDFEDGRHYYFSSAINVVRFIYGMAKCRDRIFTKETNPAYEFCLTYGEKCLSEQLLRGLEEDRGGYWYTVQENYDPAKSEEDPIYSLISDNIKATKYYHIMKKVLDPVVKDLWDD